MTLLDNIAMFHDSQFAHQIEAPAPTFRGVPIDERFEFELPKLEGRAAQLSLKEFDELQMDTIF